MTKASVSFSKVRNELLKDSELYDEYQKLKPRYEIVSAIIKARMDLNVSQEELARRTGTQKSNISRLESGNYNPSIDFLSKIAKGLGKEIRFIIE